MDVDHERKRRCGVEGCEGQRREGKKKKDMERKGAVLEREFVFVVLTNPITHSFNQS